MAKAIIFTRVSTSKQDTDAQEAALWRMAEADGFAESDITAITEVESGIKLTEEERVGLNRMKEEIERGATTLYCWEISRLGRTKKVLFSILDYLIERRVQLIVNEPSIRLLKDDGTLNEAAETIFTLYAQISESEMRIKKQRFSRAKQKMSLEGKWVGGGKVRYGYRVVNKTYEPDPVTSEHVREVFRLYLQNGAGCSSVAKAMTERGVALDKRMVLRILSFKGYMGECEIERGNRRTYPPLVTEETFREAERKRSVKAEYKDRSSAHYLGAGLVVCPECGRRYTPHASLGVYRCIASTTKGNFHAECKGGTSININALDTILWEDAKDAYMDELIDDTKQRSADLTERRRTLEQRIGHERELIEGAQRRMEVISEQYATGMMNESKYLSLCDKIKASVDNERRNEAQDTLQLSQVVRLLSELDNSTFADDYVSAVEYIKNLPRDYAYMYSLVHRLVARVSVERSTCVGEPSTKVTVTHADGTDSVYHFFPLRRKQCRYCRMADTVIGMTREQADERPTWLEDIEVLERVTPRTSRTRATA